MPFFLTGEHSDFPPVEFANEDGLLAIGGELSFDRLVNAYQKGIFPWNNAGEPVCWYCPDPRFILFPSSLKVSHSMKAIIKNKKFDFKIDQAFSDVVKNCRITKRQHQDGTWITDEIENAYTMLFNKGLAHSAEAWLDGKLVGGLYGVQLGKIFFGESMFAFESNASKFAFTQYLRAMKNKIELVDCQIYTSHLESLGAEYITRKKFTGFLEKLI
ncbi:MAG: leucyl/phenylalanyl-tRNA--protein transferase [Ginsengibacter sp.]